MKTSESLKLRITSFTNWTKMPSLIMSNIWNFISHMMILWKCWRHIAKTKIVIENLRKNLQVLKHFFFAPFLRKIYLSWNIFRNNGHGCSKNWWCSSEIYHGLSKRWIGQSHIWFGFIQTWIFKCYMNIKSTDMK